MIKEIINHYKILGIGQNATDAEIKRAFRAAAKQYHPDNRQSASPEELKKYAEKFQEAKLAYACLKDPLKRRELDVFLRVKEEETQFTPAQTATNTRRFLAKSLKESNAIATAWLNKLYKNSAGAEIEEKLGSFLRNSLAIIEKSTEAFKGSEHLIKSTKAGLNATLDKLSLFYAHIYSAQDDNFRKQMAKRATDALEKKVSALKKEDVQEGFLHESAISSLAARAYNDAALQKIKKQSTPQLWRFTEFIKSPVFAWIYPNCKQILKIIEPYSKEQSKIILEALAQKAPTMHALIFMAVNLKDKDLCSEAIVQKAREIGKIGTIEMEALTIFLNSDVTPITRLKINAYFAEGQVNDFLNKNFSRHSDKIIDTKSPNAVRLDSPVRLSNEARFRGSKEKINLDSR